MNKLILGIDFAVLSFLLVMCSCSSKRAKSAVQENGRENAEESLFAVKTQLMEGRTLEDYIEFGGTVKAVDCVSVLPNVAGKIERILVEVGDKVQKNQIIAQVDASKPGAEFTKSPVRATAAGTVISLPLSKGTFASTSTTIAEIASTDNLQVDVNVSERFVPFVRQNQNAAVTFKSYPDEKFDATITKISPVLDPDTRTMQVTLKIKETKGVIKSGMFAHVKLITQTKENAIAVPSRAIVYNNSKPFVFIVSDGKTLRKAIEIGISIDGVTEIVSGLHDGDKVVVKGQNMISDGQSVKEIAE